MTLSLKKNRIIFIDLIRAFAVLQMVQGHTVDVVLSEEYRTLDSVAYSIWYFMRGMTAPIFLFTAGTVFTYLLRLSKEEFFKNPRVKKGFIRFLTLVFLGYLLRYPTATIINFSNVTNEQWLTFFTVDVLHLIGFGLLFILILAFISENFGNKDTLVFSLGAIFFFMLWPVVMDISWSEYLPLPLTGYFYQKYGSLFPFFPWAGYLLSGALFGSYLAKNPSIFKATQFSFKLAIVGGSLLFIFIVLKSFETDDLNATAIKWLEATSLISLRVGFVLILNSLFSFFSLKINSIPKLLVLIGRNTLVIYVVHLILLYGSAWSPGLVLIYNRNMGVWATIGVAVLMLSLMTLMVILINKLKLKNRSL